MALTQAILVRLARLGGPTVATVATDGTATMRHPAAETWYAAAILDESSGAWLTLYDEAMAAKTAHFCLKYPWNADGIARGLIDSEPVMADGTRNYRYDYTDTEWWRSTNAGAYYHTLRARIGTGAKAGPFLCI